MSAFLRGLVFHGLVLRKLYFQPFNNLNPEAEIRWIFPGRACAMPFLICRRSRDSLTCHALSTPLADSSPYVMKPNATNPGSSTLKPSTQEGQAPETRKPQAQNQFRFSDLQALKPLTLSIGGSKITQPLNPLKEPETSSRVSRPSGTSA